MQVDPWRPHALAMQAYFDGRTDVAISVSDDYGGTDAHPIAYFFRGPDEFPPMEQEALRLCRGRVLDVGAGSGCHSLVLQERGFAVCALEIVPELAEIMRRRGVVDVHCGDLFDFAADPFDTVLMLMNGLEVAGTLSGLDRLLRHLRTLVAPGGQVVADSTDLRTVGEIDSGVAEREDGRYVGEVVYQLEFEGTKGPPFPRLYVDPDTLVEFARRWGWHVEIIMHSEGGGYLSRLTRPD